MFVSEQQTTFVGSRYFHTKIKKVLSESVRHDT